MWPSMRAMASPTAGPGGSIVIIAAVVVGIVEDGVARDHVKRQRLAAEPAATSPAECTNARDRGYRVAQSMACCPPIDPPTTA